VWPPDTLGAVRCLGTRTVVTAAVWLALADMEINSSVPRETSVPRLPLE